MTGTVGAYRSGFATNVTLRIKAVDQIRRMTVKQPFVSSNGSGLIDF